jgi:hypothetical protein
MADAEAVLFGLADFLKTPDLAIYKKSAKNYIRELWDGWWPQRDRLRRLILPAKIWKLSSTRPVNHPQRRLAALSILVRGLDHPFWKFHYTLTADASAEPMALVGESRVADILANVIFPFWRTEDIDVSADYAKLTAPLTNRRLETAATRLFGDNLRRREFTKTIAHQQALLQIYEDFCLQDNSNCAHCPFPEQMQKWK